MKKCFLFLMVFTLFTICSCDQITLPEESQITIPAESPSDTETLPSSCFGYTFTSQDELLKYIDNNLAVRKIIAENYPQNKKDELDPENYISIQVFSNPPFKAELFEIVYIGRSINYHYYLDGFKPTEISFAAEQISGSSEPLSEIGELKIERIEDILKGGTLEEYYEENGLSEYAINEIETANNRLTLSWDYTKNGKAGIEELARKNSSVIKKHSEGIYISDPGNPYGMESYNKVIYWSHDDYAFYSTVPARYVDDFINMLMNDKDFISFTTYQASTSMEILPNGEEGEPITTSEDIEIEVETA